MITAAVKKVGKWRTKEKEAGSQVAEIHRLIQTPFFFKIISNSSLYLFDFKH